MTNRALVSARVVFVDSSGRLTQDGLQILSQINAAVSGGGTFQPLNTILTGVSGMGAGTGVVAQTAAATFAKRTLTGSSPILISNGNGVAGNPTFSGDIASAAEVAAGTDPTKIVTPLTLAGVLTAGRVMIVEDQKASGTNGGTFTLGADRIRVLNTVVSNNITGAALAANQISLDAGTYQIAWSCPAYNVGLHQSFLYNVTDAAEVARGQSCQTAGAGNVQTDSTGETIVTIAGTKAFEIRHRCSVTAATFGLGNAGSFGTEVYARVIVIKIG